MNKIKKYKIKKYKIKKYKIKNLNYKNIVLLRKYISPAGKILPKRLTGLTTKQQRLISKAIKHARILGFLPFIRITFY